MDGSSKGFSPSTHCKPSSIPKIPGSDSKGLKKSTSNKSMSPTISSAAKSTPPRKKILGERNEVSGSILSETHFSKTPQDRKSPLSSCRATESEDDDQNSAPDQSSRPYDPVTNYLSPRPKFLRYNPNRRRGNFLLRESEIKEGKDRLGTESKNGGDEDGAPSQEQKEDEEIVEDVEEIEEEEEVRGGGLKGVLNTLFVFVMLVLSTSYISSMNSPTPSPTVEAMEVLKDGYLQIQSHIFGAVSVNDLEVDGLTRATVGIFQNGYSKIQSLILGATSVKIPESQSGFMVACQEVIDGNENEGVAEESEHGGVAEGSEDFCDQVTEFEEETTEKVEAFQDDLIENHELAFPEKNDTMDTDSISMDEQDDGDSEVWGGENEEVVAEEVEGGVEEDIADKENLDIGVANLEQDDGDSEVWGGENEEVVAEEVEGGVEEDIADKESLDIGVANLEQPGLNLKEEEQEEKVMETESIPKMAIWASSLFATIVAASLVLGFLLKRQKTPKKDSTMAVNQCSDSVVEEKIEKVAVLAPPPLPTEKVESYTELLLVEEEEEASQGFSQSRAPTVELLAEFVVGGGEVTSTTPNTFSMKSRMMTEEEEGEEESSRYSASQERRGTRSVSIRTPVAALSAPSGMDSSPPSYGSFTAEKSVSRKKEVTTPVRRSSRIRNRGIMSP